jgi:hypothetical protein
MKLTRNGPEMTIADGKEIDKGLQLALAGNYGDREARESIIQAGISGDQRFIPILKEIAEATSKDKNHKVTYDALHSVWQLGEDKEYFLENAQSYQKNKWLAYYSILILGRDPNDDKTLEVMNEIKTVSSDNQIRGAIAESERVRLLATHYKKLESAREKCNFLLNNFRSTWNPISLGETELGSPTSPQAIWSQRELFNLSQESPEVVALAIFAIDLSESYEDESFTKSYQDYVARLISVKAREKLQKLQEQTKR